MFLTVVRVKGDSARISVTLHDTNKHAVCTIFVHKLVLSRARKVLLHDDLKNGGNLRKVVSNHIFERRCRFASLLFFKKHHSPHNAENTRRVPQGLLSSREKFGRHWIVEQAKMEGRAL
jgi:hypothetical protein